MTYPVLFLRIKALMLDSVIFATLIFGMAFLIIEFKIEAPEWKAAIILTPAILFEPAMIWLTGGSIGHHYAGIRVIGKNSGKNLFILNGIVRFFAKTLFGVFSLAAMLITRQHQALHDLLSSSVVVFKNEAAVSPRHKLKTRETTYLNQKPSIGRRFAVIIAYSAIFYLMFGISIYFLASGACIEHGLCTKGESAIIDKATMVFLITIIVVFILGFMCKLPGAYSRVKKDN